MSSGVANRLDWNQPAELHILAMVLIFYLRNERYNIVQAANNQGADQTAWMHRLVCTVLLLIGAKAGFLCCGWF